MIRPSDLFRETQLYQRIVAEGRAEGRAEGLEQGRLAEARRLLTTLGSGRLGSPDEATVNALHRDRRCRRIGEAGPAGADSLVVAGAADR
jgi:hypothetical protein